MGAGDDLQLAFRKVFCEEGSNEISRLRKPADSSFGGHPMGLPFNSDFQVHSYGLSRHLPPLLYGEFYGYNV